VAYDKDAWRASVTNGKIPRSKLAEIEPAQYDPDLQGPALMHPEAARAMGDMLRAAAGARHAGLRVRYSYRTLAKQWEKWNDYQAGGNLAAYPGTSNHGWAVACDLTWGTSGDILWAHENAQRFGFRFDVPIENWHITYQGGYEPPEGVDDVKYEKFKDGYRKYQTRAKEQGKDPGPVPSTMTDPDAKFGWQAARFGFTNGGKNEAG
jgi:hypothetical protein